MAVESRLIKVSVNMRLDNGTSEGVQKYATVSLGNLNVNSYADQNAMNIATLAGPCFAKNMLGVQKVEVSDLTNNS